MPLCFEEQFELQYFDCDPWDRMRPGAALRRAQEIATRQCESLGIDRAFYKRTGTAFLLARLSLVVNRMPQVGQVVRLQTRAYGMRRAVYHRMTSLHDQSGEKLWETDGRWVLTDLASRRILRKPFDEFLPYFNEPPGAEEHAMDMPKPAELALCAERQATYSLCDRNGHINNTGYADIMCDALPPQLLQRYAPRQMLLHYRSEIPMGSAFEVHSAQVNENGHYFLVGCDGGKNFEGFVTFQDQ